MKRQFFAIILLLISFSFVFSTKSYATACCDNYYTYDTATGMCQPYYGGPQVEIKCDPVTEVCGGSTCVPNTIPECDSHTSCGNQDYIDTHIGCTTYGVNNGTVPWCTYLGAFAYPTIPVVRGNNPVFCNGTDISDGINTALGCIPVGSGNDLITAILRFATGIGGGIALALILYGVFIVTTSAGMPDKLKAGSEIITSAIIGLIFILLSIFLVNLIGINILGIPGLS